MTIVKIFITNNFFLFLLYSIAGDLSMGTRRKNVKSLRIFRLFIIFHCRRFVNGYEAKKCEKFANIPARGAARKKVCLATRARHKEREYDFPSPTKNSPLNKYPPAKPEVFHFRAVSPHITGSAQAALMTTWQSCDCYLLPVNGSSKSSILI